MDIELLTKKISSERLADNLWRLVNVPSPTCNEKNAAECFARLLKEAGANVETDYTIPQSPNVIGRLKGKTAGATLQLAGHLDHIDMPHPQPKRDEKIISGRGSADMKNGLSGILEIVKILKDGGCDFSGEILVTAFGLHEAPLGNSAGLFNLIDKGIKGDSAIVFEGPDDAAVVCANGMAIWNLTIKSAIPSCHELCAPQDMPDLLAVALNIADALKAKDVRLQNTPNPFPLLAQESLFIGQLHYGDFYNRIPSTAFLQGTRRWHPGKTLELIQRSFDLCIKKVSLPDTITVEQNWQPVGDSYQIDAEEKIVKSFVNAFKTVHKKDCPVRGHSSVNDTCRLVHRGKIPAILCGFGTDTGHADYEFIEIAKIKKCCEVALRTVLNFLEK